MDETPPKTRDASGEPPSARRNRVRGRPFKLGNPGRPPGSKNKVSQLIEQLAEGEAEQLIKKVLELANKGDVSCLRMALDRLWPVRKGQPVNFDMPAVKSADDMPAAMRSIWAAVAVGQLTPDEAVSFSQLLVS